jgi:hypothetical protein
MGSPFDQVTRAAFTVVALVVLGFVAFGWLDSASADGMRLGTAPEWVGAGALLLIAAGVWKIARVIERDRSRSGS